MTGLLTGADVVVVGLVVVLEEVVLGALFSLERLGFGGEVGCLSGWFPGLIGTEGLIGEAGFLGVDDPF